jgi:single-strand DNA-binding protein
VYQKTSVIGNLGCDPKFQFTSAGLEVCNFSVASNRQHKDGSEDKIWFSVAVFGNQAKPCSDYLHKGSKVFVEGRLKANENGNPGYFTKSDGNIGTTFNLSANQVLFLDGKTSEPDEESQEADW